MSRDEMIARNDELVVIGIGEVLWDILPQGMHLGGAPANFAYYAHAHGARSYVVSAVGEDELGRRAIERLSELSIPVDYISRHPDFPTGTVSVELSGDGQPEYRIHERVAWDHIPYLRSLSVITKEADAVCFGTLAQRSVDSRTAIQNILNAVPERACKVFDVNLRGSFYNPEIIEYSLNIANVLKLNEQELPVISGMFGLSGDEPALLDQLQKRYNLNVIVLTKGECGSLIMSDGHMSVHRGIKTKVADTIGAGDAFTSSLVMGLLYGYSLDDLHECASRVAAFVCSNSGATTPLPCDLRMTPRIMRY